MREQSAIQATHPSTTVEDGSEPPSSPLPVGKFRESKRLYTHDRR